MTDDKKQLKKELSERQCPECLKISYYGDWEYVKPKKGHILYGDGAMKCPKCGAVCDVE